MAQYQSKKGKSKQLKKPAVVYCEGKAEENLWKYLKQVLKREERYIRDVLPNRKNHDRSGGDCKKIIERAQKHRNINDGDVCFVIIMMDTDNRYQEALPLIQKKRNIKNPVWTFVLCKPCLEQVIADLIGKGDYVSATTNKKEAIKNLTKKALHDIDWEVFLKNHNKSPKDILSLPAFAEVQEILSPPP